MTETKHIMLMAVGNPTVEDDGIGPYCLERLLQWFEFPPDLRCVDEGDLGPAILADLIEVRELIVIDAAKDTGHPAGTVLIMTPEEMAANAVLHTAHDMALIDVLRMAMLTDKAPERTIVVGMQVASLREWEMQLTPEVQAAAPIMCAAALDQLRQRGVDFTPKPDADIPAELFDALANFAPQKSSE
ncbi:MAG: hydrogenase maturation protease [Coriobacteriia bacterium]|nr:hydrogenase maturation protease [Coriobacteriia bacterium]